MKEIALARINSFAPVQANVPPSEEPVFILTSGQLQDLITQAVQPFQDELSDLKATVAHLQEDITVLGSTQEQDTTRICVDIAHDRQRISRLERVEPQPMQKDRGEILRALLAANGGKMLAKDARQKMRLSKSRFSELLGIMKDTIESRPSRLNKRQNILVLI
jgi:hypothetical protein